MSTWNYRTAQHYTIKDGERVLEDYVTVHEVYYDDDGKPEGFVASEAVVRSKKEAEYVALAFDKPHALIFDDESIRHEIYAEGGETHIDYAVWNWIEN